MRYYFAPLEGITDSTYRALHHRFFPGVHRYFTPFFSPTSQHILTARELRELPPADTIEYDAVPQLLTKHSEDFYWMSQQCKDIGYTEVNLNLGCPSGTVTAKGKGSGMLTDLATLDQFLDEIFYRSPVEISVKTRIGFREPEEFPALLEIFNKYPIKELIIHPRVRTAFYKGNVDMDAFHYAYTNSKNPLCYNGDLHSLEQITALGKAFPNVESYMVGRGLVADPGLFTKGGTQPQQLQKFYEALLQSYVERFGGARNAMFRLKEHWGMLIRCFDNVDKLAKRLRKTTDIQEFQEITHQILETCPFVGYHE